MSLSAASLPAATTNSTPWLPASATASHSGWEKPGPPHEALMTFAPFATAYWIAVIASEVNPPPGLRNLRGMMRALSATPAMPIALPRSAAIVPETCVPWLSPSAAL